MKKKHIIIVLIAGLLILANFAKYLLPERNNKKTHTDTAEYKIKKRKKEPQETIRKDSIKVKKHEDLPYNPTDSKANIRLMS